MGVLASNVGRGRHLSTHFVIANGKNESHAIMKSGLGLQPKHMRHILPAGCFKPKLQTLGPNFLVVSGLLLGGRSSNCVV